MKQEHEKAFTTELKCEKGIMWSHTLNTQGNVFMSGLPNGA